MTPDRLAALAAVAPLRAAHGLFLTDADHLRVSSWNALTTVTSLTITGRFINTRHEIAPFTFRHVPNTDRTIAQSLHALGEGWLEHVAVVSNGAPRLGQVFVRLELVRGLSGGTSSMAILTQGLCNAVQPLAWPATPAHTTLERPGALRVMTGTNPAANTEISETVPTGARWRVHVISFQLVTDGTAANREVGLLLDTVTDRLAQVVAGFNHTASLTLNYSAHNTGAIVSPTQAIERMLLLPPIVLPAASRIATLTTNLQAGDNYNAPQLLVEEWLEVTS